MKNINYKNNNNYILNNNSNNNIHKAGAGHSRGDYYPYEYINKDNLQDTNWINFILKYNIIAFYGKTDKGKRSSIDHIYNYDILGNFTPIILTFKFHNKEYHFPNAEAAFHASKFHDDNMAARVLNIIKGQNLYTILQNIKRKNPNKNILILYLSNLNKNLEMDNKQVHIDGQVTLDRFRAVDDIIRTHIDKNINYDYCLKSDELLYDKYKLSNRVMRMIIVLRKKFIENSKNGIKLLQTNNRYLLEYNMGYAKDNTWSDGKKGEGLNLLGIVLMIIRDELKVKTILQPPSSFTMCIDYYIPKLEKEYELVRDYISPMLIFLNDRKKQKPHPMLRHALWNSYKTVEYISEIIQNIQCSKTDKVKYSFGYPQNKTVVNPYGPKNYEFLFNIN